MDDTVNTYLISLTGVMAALVIATLGTCAMMLYFAWKMAHTATVTHAVLVDLSTKVQKAADELRRFGSPTSQTEDATDEEEKGRSGATKDVDHASIDTWSTPNSPQSCNSPLGGVVRSSPPSVVSLEEFWGIAHQR